MADKKTQKWSPRVGVNDLFNAIFNLPPPKWEWGCWMTSGDVFEYDDELHQVVAVHSPGSYTVIPVDFGMDESALGPSLLYRDIEEVKAAAAHRKMFYAEHGINVRITAIPEDDKHYRAARLIAHCLCPAPPWMPAVEAFMRLPVEERVLRAPHDFERYANFAGVEFETIEEDADGPEDP